MFLDILFPNRCLHCNLIIHAEELICTLCENQIAFTPKNAFEDTLKQKCSLLFPVEHAWSLMQFQELGLSRKIIHQLKYGSREKVGKILAEWTFDRIILPEISRPEIILTVPLHPQKLKKRGYNQLHLFADTLSEKWNIPHHKTALQRNSYQKAQAKKDKLHRSKTEYDFSLTEPITGKHILLIDDVFTTGNTLSAVAWEILKEPSNKISILVMAWER